jgi:hypothetical protein
LKSTRQVGDPGTKWQGIRMAQRDMTTASPSVSITTCIVKIEWIGSAASIMQTRVVRTPVFAKTFVLLRRPPIQAKRQGLLAFSARRSVNAGPAVALGLGLGTVALR